jgi:hypothetical protein
MACLAGGLREHQYVWMDHDYKIALLLVSGMDTLYGWLTGLAGWDGVWVFFIGLGFGMVG